MPVYLVHGFRWPRPLIRIHIILQNLDDAAAEWLIAPSTTRTMLENFRQNYPHIMTALPKLRFVEQHDPNDETIKGQPYAYVADLVHEVKLGIDIDEIRGKGVANEQWTALLELRDKLCPGEKVAWFVVVCGDEERLVPTAAKLQPAIQEDARYTNGHDWPAKESSDRSGSRQSHHGEQNGTTAHKLKRSNSLSRGFRKIMGFDKPKELQNSSEPKQSKGIRSFRSLTSMRSRDQLRSAYNGNSNQNSKDQSRSAYSTPEPPPPLPGTAH